MSALRSASPEEDRCIIMVQIFDRCRTPVAVRSEDEVYDRLFLTWREQLLLDSFVAACTSTVVTMPLGGVGKLR